MKLYRLVLCFVALLCIVGIAVARNEVILAQGGAAQMISEHNATVQKMQTIVTVVLTPTPRPTLIDRYNTPCCYQTFEFGTLWNKHDPRAYVFVVGMVHDEYPLNEEQANDWVSRGEGCYADAGSKFMKTHKEPDNDFGIGIKLLSRNCAEFEGWVSMTVVNYQLTNPLNIIPFDDGG